MECGFLSALQPSICRGTQIWPTGSNGSMGQLEIGHFEYLRIHFVRGKCDASRQTFALLGIHDGSRPVRRGHSGCISEMAAHPSFPVLRIPC